MTLIASSTFAIADASIESGAVSLVVLPAASAGAGGRGRLTHPTLGVYDYLTTPSETVGLDGDVLIAPTWAHTPTLSSAVDTLWAGNVRDAHPIERWINGDTGGPIAHLRALWAMYVNPPDPVTGTPIVWAPSYATARTYKVAIVSLKAGGEEGIKLDRRLLQDHGYAPPPVEIEYRILGYAN